MNDHPSRAVPHPRVAPWRALALALRRRSRGARHLLRLLLVAAIFAVSLIPAMPTLNGWTTEEIPPVQELRPLAAYPSAWEGSVFDADKNYARFEKAFADQLGLRSLMIRTKNEIDFRLFRTSRRVYYGKKGELYGRSIADAELPLTEKVLATQEQQDASYEGVLDLSARLRAAGITMVMMTPVQKQYFTRERLPFFAPRVPDDSHFMHFYQRLKATPELHFVDIIALMHTNEGKFAPFFKQDFHWSEPMAMAAAADAVRVIAELEGSPLRWHHRLELEVKPFIGVEMRFAGRLNMHKDVLEPQLKKTWTEVHQRRELDAAATGVEFDTGNVERADLLPPTCLYGNSFSDGMLRAGLVEHFQKFTKISRSHELHDVPALVAGRCKYLIVQVLDIQADRWVAFATRR
ncbi:alginate O-acetyltransferase AlgX-related protein [Massilia antarctica]|uniref:alginate O-acetyltransferase AlgX-related protein n=1 Tax=Massilia antarctica TaxID=2765360 RepID=UPI0006BB80DF|nr:hypothetical protein [Massilia sp. H27-R4]MCY0911070.1 hypothetical protein [Massilia sp. H27-R4]CUI05351.1 hypothetical protein BN2497_5479 [Janthinobacterium sp. CG23_2]CUU29137.1 hypothetical protein BN3177_5479 [Janthinobacterium sp. CG23_2]